MDPIGASLRLMWTIEPECPALSGSERLCRKIRSRRGVGWHFLRRVCRCGNISFRFRSTAASSLRQRCIGNALGACWKSHNRQNRRKRFASGWLRSDL